MPAVESLRDRIRHHLYSDQRLHIVSTASLSLLRKGNPLRCFTTEPFEHTLLRMPCYSKRRDSLMMVATGRRRT